MTDEAAWLASLRPSRIREVQAGEPAWTRVRIVDVASGQGPALRAALEQFRVAVELIDVGQARHLVRALRMAPAPFVILGCHGDEGAIMLPELAAELERHQPHHGRVTPDELGAFARFEGATVISTGCDTGHPDLVRAVLDAGAAAYVAPAGAPFAYASFVAPVLLFYELTEMRSLDDAVARLRAYDDELATWMLHRPDEPRS